MNVGTLTIEMAANVVRIQQDMDRIRQTVDGTMAKVQKAASMASTALGALGVGLSAGAFASWIKGAVDMADQAQKLSQKIGVAVKDMGGLQLAFQQGGIDFDAFIGQHIGSLCEILQLGGVLIRDRLSIEPVVHRLSRHAEGGREVGHSRFQHLTDANKVFGRVANRRHVGHFDRRPHVTHLMGAALQVLKRQFTPGAEA